MYLVKRCPCCHSPDIVKRPAKLARFVAWRSTGTDPMEDTENRTMTCNKCTFTASDLRLTEQEEANLYRGYREDGYNTMRIECEPNYQERADSFDQEAYIEVRKKGINALIKRNLDPRSIYTVLDYGGDTGIHIPAEFVRANKYVYDISGVTTVSGILTFDPTANIDPIDFLMCCQVLEHKSNVDELIEELKIYADTNTWIYIEVPNYQNPPPINIVFHEHINFFSRRSLEALLNRHGIQVVDAFEEENLCILGKLK